MDPYLRSILHGSAGALLEVCRPGDGSTYKGILVQVGEVFRVVFAELPGSWPEKALELECALASDSGWLHFATRAWRQGATEIAFPAPTQVTAIRERRHVRVPVELSVALRPSHPAGTHHVTEISAGGFRLRGNVELWPGQLLELAFLDPGWQDLGWLTGHVIRRIDAGPPASYGLTFVGLQASQSAGLAKLLLTRLRAWRAERRQLADRLLPSGHHQGL